MRQRAPQPGGEVPPPAVIFRFGEAQPQKHPGRRRAHRGKIGQVHRQQFPGDIAGRGGGQIMHAGGQHVMGENQIAP